MILSVFEEHCVGATVELNGRRSSLRRGCKCMIHTLSCCFTASRAAFIHPHVCGVTVTAEKCQQRQKKIKKSFMTSAESGLIRLFLQLVAAVCRIVSQVFVVCVSPVSSCRPSHHHERLSVFVQKSPRLSARLCLVTHRASFVLT